MLRVRRSGRATTAANHHSGSNPRATLVPTAPARQCDVGTEETRKAGGPHLGGENIANWTVVFCTQDFKRTSDVSPLTIEDGILEMRVTVGDTLLRGVECDKRTVRTETLVRRDTIEPFDGSRHSEVVQRLRRPLPLKRPSTFPFDVSCEG